MDKKGIETTPRSTIVPTQRSTIVPEQSVTQHSITTRIKSPTKQQ